MAYTEEEQNIPLAGIAENLDQIKRFDGPPAEFWPAFLEWVTQVTGAKTGLLLVKESDAGSWKNLIAWPAEDSDLIRSAQMKPLVEDIAETSAHKGYAWLDANAQDSGALLGARIKLEEEDRLSVVVLWLSDNSGLNTEEAAMRLLLVIDTPMVYQLARMVNQAKLDVAHFSESLDVMVLLNDEKRYVGAAMIFCNELAARYNCERVSLGWLKGAYLRVQAISHMERFEKKMDAVQTLEAAMEEAFDQDEEILWPPPPDTFFVARDHEAFAREQGVSYMASVPIRLDDTPVGVLTCERSLEPFSEEDARGLRVICDQAGRRLGDLKRHDRWFGARLATAFKEALAKVFGVEHTFAKLLKVLISAALLFVVFGKWQYRVEAPFMLKTDDLAFLPAPFDGYIQDVHVEVGDRVADQAPLLTLDTRELLLEESNALANRNRYKREAEKARSQKALADMQIAQALEAQARARFDLVHYHIEHARVKAPFAGIVVEGDLEELLGAPVRKGDILFKVARLEKMYAELKVDQRDVHEIGDRLTGEIAFVSRPDLKFPIVVERIDPVAAADEEGNVFVVRAGFSENISSWWRPGMSGVAKINVGRRRILWILTHRTIDFFACFCGGNMPKESRTFSESWHRVAGLRVSLRPTVKVRKQLFRGEIWYILSDPFNNQFFRLRPEAHDFVIRLGPRRTVEEVWLECLQRRPDEAPGQEDVIQLLTQLYFANLLYFEVPADSAKLFERYRRRRQREIKSKLLSIMFVRIPLIDPDHFLRRLLPLFKLIFSPLGLIAWLLVVAAAGKLVIDRFDQVTDQVQGILAPDNLFLLYAGLVIIKTLHEFGHAALCRRFGGEVHTMGVMLLVFTPLPYMDATSSWSFRSRWQRALVGGAGMIVEVFVAALATFLWAYTGPGTLHSLAYNIMFIASVSTVLFNANPLLRFDGYYILSDLLDIPNLHTRSKGHLRHLAERYLFGYKDSNSPTESLKEAGWLTIFGILAGIYRVVVFTGIILFVADKFLLAGLLMAMVCVISWVVVPVYKLIKYLASSPRLARTRLRAVTVVVCFLVALTTVLAIVPFPNRFRAPGVLEAVNYARIVNDAPGYLRSVLVASGRLVQEGTPLVELSDRELELEIEAVEAQRAESVAMYRKALRRQKADLEPIRKRLETIVAKLADLKKQQADLVIRARQAGIWVAPEVQDMAGAWLSRGTVIGTILDPAAFRFLAVVSQDEAAELFGGRIQKAEVRLFGQAGQNLTTTKLMFIPFQQEKLPSAALGWLGGGEVPVAATDETGLQTVEPFFQIHATLESTARAALLHGRAGKLRFTLNPKPLLLQWGHKIRQILQKRYQI